MSTRHPRKKLFPNEVDLSSYRARNMTFTDGEGNELFAIQFNRDTWICRNCPSTPRAQMELGSSITFFDLKV